MNSICTRVHQLFNERERFRFPFGLIQIPFNGIYVLFEIGEQAHDVERIVRVGTHTGDNQLRARLQQHFVQENKDRSIFRKNIGRALLNRAGDPFLEQWNWDLTTNKAKATLGPLLDKNKQQAVEKQVSEYMQNHFSFVVFEVPEKSQRLWLESKLISTISRCEECRPSSNWLGLYSPKEKIRQSGLWLVNELYREALTEGELAELEELLGKNVAG